MKAYPVAPASELRPGTRRTVVVEGREIVVMNVGGSFYAVRNRCAHQGGPIGEGPVTRTVFARAERHWEPEPGPDHSVLRCPWHGMEYELASGNAIGNPRSRVRIYETQVNEDGVVEVLL
jgi:nitrite reductase (NADH) small subunit